MKYIIIPLFRLITLPILVLLIISILLLYILYCLWHFDFTDFMNFEDMSLSKNKPLYIEYGSFDNRKYSYQTLLDYILNKKSK